MAPPFFFFFVMKFNKKLLEPYLNIIKKICKPFMKYFCDFGFVVMYIFHIHTNIHI